MIGVILMEIRAELAAGKLDEIGACVPSPPWVKYPEFGKGGPGDLGFRMGEGQDYMDEWRDWFAGMSKKNRQRYLILFDVPSLVSLAVFSKMTNVAFRRVAAVRCAMIGRLDLALNGRSGEFIVVSSRP